MPLTDVYQRQIGDASAMAADAAKLTFGAASGLAGVGFMAQNISVSYTQQITKIFELGSNNILYVAGRTQGQIQIARVVGSKTVAVAFYNQFGNVCNVDRNEFLLSAETSCQRSGSGVGVGTVLSNGGGGTINYEIKQAIVNSLGVTIQSQDMVINESVQMMFGFLAVK
jgi:hypothetical protein